ncbi:hypothetical protein CISIN_1g033123mg [Citrus sinensis]|uniref:Uncharacterized protein n=1 Tax=Citrus sinensis TaxID=2711 RepID=A0A067DEL5_CITSI|nr:hypothetical protein CISIN_1g033123mg [Citrus sinensis]
MASFFALKTLASSSIPPRALRSTISSSATWACRFFNTTNAFREYDDDGGDDREFDFERSSARSFTPSFFPGARLLSVRFISHIMWTDINHSNCFLYFTELIRDYCQILWSNFDIPCTVVYYGQVYP